MLKPRTQNVCSLDAICPPFLPLTNSFWVDLPRFKGVFSYFDTTFSRIIRQRLTLSLHETLMPLIVQRARSVRINTTGENVINFSLFSVSLIYHDFKSQRKSGSSSAEPTSYFQPRLLSSADLSHLGPFVGTQQSRLKSKGLQLGSCLSKNRQRWFLFHVD